jgi:chromosome segregation ATPase
VVDLKSESVWLRKKLEERESELKARDQALDEARAKGGQALEDLKADAKAQREAAEQALRAQVSALRKAEGELATLRSEVTALRNGLEEARKSQVAERKLREKAAAEATKLREAEMKNRKETEALERELGALKQALDNF